MVPELDARRGRWQVARGRDDRTRRSQHLGIPARPAHSGVPYLRPHGALLYKAPRPLDKNEADFRVSSGQLTANERKWLTDALAVAYPGHPWIRRLANR